MSSPPRVRLERTASLRRWPATCRPHATAVGLGAWHPHGTAALRGGEVPSAGIALLPVSHRHPDRGWREPRAARPLATLGVGAFPGQIHTGKVELAPDSAARSPVHFSHDRNKKLPIFCFGHLEGHFLLLAATRIQVTPLPPPRHTARRLQAPDPSNAYTQVLGQILSTKGIDSLFPKQKKYKLQQNVFPKQCGHDCHIPYVG